MLARLADRKSLVILGLNSGTSADGLDLAAVTVRRGRSGVKAVFLKGKSAAYPPNIRKLILRIADSEKLPVAEIVYLDNLLGQWYGRAARSFISGLKRSNISVDAVASHGQTVRHLPRAIRFEGHTVRGTLQLGSLAHIAAACGKVTVGDFRQSDVALGGEGAPITVAAMRILFGSPTQTRLIVNVGGMSNYFCFPPESSTQRITAADCGPGNVLSDLLCRELYGEPYDRNGAHASRGTVSKRLLSLLQSSPYFSGRNQSTGREDFGPKLATRMIRFGKSMHLSADDLLGTAIELTASCISRSVKPLVTESALTRRVPAAGLYLTGGGSHNKFLCRRLSEMLGGLKVTTVRDLGMDPDLVEASAFAVMGACAIWSHPLPTQFRGKVQRIVPISGAICQPPSGR
jgi:anhydro-N-acetylmuramic acid kinase